MAVHRKVAKQAAKSPKRAKPVRNGPSRGLRVGGKRAKIRSGANGLGIASTRAVVHKLSDPEALALARHCRDAALDKKAEGVLLLDIRDRAAFADYFVVATGRSVLQARAVADAVVEASELDWGAPMRTEGYNDGTWILVDYGAVIVHVFTPQAREFYNLERLWGKPSQSSKKK
jgi:ribosome-associated protein